MVAYLIPNGAGLLLSICDAYYYPYSKSRITLTDFIMVKDSSISNLFLDILIESRLGILLFAFLLFFLFLVYRCTRFLWLQRIENSSRDLVLSLSAVLLTAVLSVYFLRGRSFSAGSTPLSMNDAFMYTNEPLEASIILSNPFCLIRTIRKGAGLPAHRFFSDKTASDLYPTTGMQHKNAPLQLKEKPNVMLIILESFGAAHSHALSSSSAYNGQGCMPFLDSLMTKSYNFTNAYQNGRRSVDALPAIWNSIPSFSHHFLSLPNSIASYEGLPLMMKRMGYRPVFFHGSVRESMGFVSFGEINGIEDFFMREDYEKILGPDDFDGKWGIWDHKFFPFVHDRLNNIAQEGRPFFATLFTLSSHHPFKIPAEKLSQYKEGNMPIHKVIRYSDDALRDFFTSVSSEPWFDNTLFIITADHSSGSAEELYQHQPYAFQVPLLFYYPGGNWKAADNRVMQHMDVMPTVLDLLGCEKPYFGFGRSHFEKMKTDHFAVNYADGLYNCTFDDYSYSFDGEAFIGKYAYHGEAKPREVRFTAGDTVRFRYIKALLQQYSLHLKNKNYKPGLQ